MLHSTQNLYLLSVGCSLSLFFHSISAEIVLEDASTLSPSPEAGYQIDASLGTQVGHNLFHTFQTFNLDSNERATFTGTGITNPDFSIQNILSRVTGGSASIIDGTLASSIEGANLFLFNPSGLVFGPNASLDISGAFYASTADYIRFNDNEYFHAHLFGDDHLSFTMASPASFGFLTQNPAKISFNNSQIQAHDDSGLFIIGGDISLTSSYIEAEKSQVSLISIATAGEFDINQQNFLINTQLYENTTDLNIASQESGRININENSVIAAEQVVLRGGKLEIKSSVITNIPDNNTELYNNHFSDIHIELTDQVLIKDESQIIVNGDAKEITLSTKQLSMQNGASIGLIGTSEATLANLIITAKKVTIDGKTNNNLKTQILGKKSNITIDSTELYLTNGGNIETEGGDIHVRNNSITRLSGVSVNGNKRTQMLASAPNNGDAGNITLETERLEIYAGARISSSTKDTSTGQAGVVDITAADRIILNGVGGRNNNASSLQAETQGTNPGSGKGGKLMITTSTLEVKNGAQISTRTRGAGAGGNIDISATNIQLNDGTITAESDGFGVNIDTQQENAGNINIVAASFLNLDMQSEITTSVADGKGSGGNITINAPDLLILNSASKVKANALEGVAGNITININKGGAFLQTSNSFIEASNERNINGNIDINAPDTDITSRFKSLPSRIIDASTVLQRPCAQRYYTNTISFVNQHYEVLPDSPYALRTVSPDSTLSAESYHLSLDPDKTPHINPDEAMDILCR